FQAEDGIRDSSVTGVQTCALPISRDMTALVRYAQPVELHRHPLRLSFPDQHEDGDVVPPVARIEPAPSYLWRRDPGPRLTWRARSEERSGGNEDGHARRAAG